MPFTVGQMRDAVGNSLGEASREFNVNGIVEQIRKQYGDVHPQQINPEDYDRLIAEFRYGA